MPAPVILAPGVVAAGGVSALSAGDDRVGRYAGPLADVLKRDGAAAFVAAGRRYVAEDAFTRATFGEALGDPVAAEWAAIFAEHDARTRPAGTAFAQPLEQAADAAAFAAFERATFPELADR